MPNFSKIIPFPGNASLHILRSAPASHNAYPRFAKAFGNRTPTREKPLVLPLEAARKNAPEHLAPSWLG